MRKSYWGSAPNSLVGDLHGDLDQARCALEMAGVLSSDGQDLWTGEETVLIQVGDILDRGVDEIAILSLLRSLSIQAKIKGGAVFQVNGNHETMNVEGDFRYVDPGAFDECIDFLEHLKDCGDNWDDAFVGWHRVSEMYKENNAMSQSQWTPWRLMKDSSHDADRLIQLIGQRQKGVVARSSLFRPGGLLARELARHTVVLKVDDWVFCHGGLLPHHVAYGIERMNREVSHWMQGFDDDDDGGGGIPFIATRGYDSVVWNRLYSSDSAAINYRSWQASNSEHYMICSTVEETLQAIGAQAMVVGHTPQVEGVNCKCNKRIWRIDVGMSSGVMNSSPEVLEIADNKARVLRNEADSFDELQTVEYT
ncbi:hypothetical protein QJS04_geneDACA005967 [Acorus gramineus]|uniref:Calcineurin-like phosphoesterase domain-containing protein n=1 Tax=Acorus gramineus TaxID=55184 RepID=A0AAV9B790_ACOGR|nr:hypothetical protein QJS04_geneDACA005967 [Acorus gramineus]